MLTFCAILRKSNGGGNDSAASLSLAVQRNILLVSLKSVNAVDILLYAVTFHKAGRYHVCSVIDGE